MFLSQSLPCMRPLLFTLIMVATVIIVIAAAANIIGRHKSETGQAIVKLPASDGRSVEIRAEVASTGQQRETGLMFRKSLGRNEGMLFLFPDLAVRNFWMKNTLIPLDMIFISENLTIIRIHHAVPCTTDPCPTYSSGEPAKYVLEVNGNATADYDIRAGSRVEITQ